MHRFPLSLSVHFRHQVTFYWTKNHRCDHRWAHRGSSPCVSSWRSSLVVSWCYPFPYLCYMSAWIRSWWPPVTPTRWTNTIIINFFVLQDSEFSYLGMNPLLPLRRLHLQLPPRHHIQALWISYSTYYSAAIDSVRLRCRLLVSLFYHHIQDKLLMQSRWIVSFSWVRRLYGRS